MLKILRFTSSFSEAASITRSQSAKAARSGAGAIRSTAASTASASSARRSTSLPKPLRNVSMPPWVRASDTSFSSTSMPASPQTWAIPVPICPAPITPTFEICMD